MKKLLLILLLISTPALADKNSELYQNCKIYFKECNRIQPCFIQRVYESCLFFMSIYSRQQIKPFLYELEEAIKEIENEENNINTPSD